MIPSFSPRSAPLELSGASRSTIVIRWNHRRLASMSFSCSRENLAGYAQSNISRLAQHSIMAARQRRHFATRRHARASRADPANRSRSGRMIRSTTFIRVTSGNGCGCGQMRRRDPPMPVFISRLFRTLKPRTRIKISGAHLKLRIG